MTEQEPIVRRLGVYAQTGTGICTAVHEALIRSDAATRYWALDSYAGTVQATTSLILKCNATNARLVLRASDTSPSTVLCSYHPAPNVDGNTEEVINLSAVLNSNLTTNGTPELRITGNSTTYTLNHATYGIKLSTGANLDSGFMIEMEDAITIVFNGNATATTNNWVYSCHAGIIMSPDNLSDASYGVDGSGIMCGFYGTYNSTGGLTWLHTNSANNVESRIRVGPTSWEQINVPRLYPPSGNYVTPVNIAPIGDANNVERLVPWRLYGETGGALGSMRYVRQRYLIKAVSVTTPALASGHLTDRNNIVVSKNDKIVLGSNPNIAWIHQIPFDTVANATQQNLVHIWNNNGYVS